MSLPSKSHTAVQPPPPSRFSQNPPQLLRKEYAPLAIPQNSLYFIPLLYHYRYSFTDSRHPCAIPKSRLHLLKPKHLCPTSRRAFRLCVFGCSDGYCACHWRLFSQRWDGGWWIWLWKHYYYSSLLLLLLQLFFFWSFSAGCDWDCGGWIGGWISMYCTLCLPQNQGKSKTDSSIVAQG